MPARAWRGPSTSGAAGDDETAVVKPLPHDYTAYGLHVRSPIALPFGPRPGRPAGVPDVVVRFGPTPAALPAPARVRKKVGIQWEAAPGTFLMNVDGAARYLVSDGRDVLVELCGSSDSEIVGSLTGPVFAALLQQRGVVPFHASAIETRAGAVLFAGHSGSGKSSLLAALVERGYAMLADDVAGVVLDAAGRPEALAAFPVTRLWADAVHVLGWRGRTRGRVHEAVEKYLAPVERFCTSPRVVRAVFCVLASHDRDGIEVEPLRASAAFHRLWDLTYRRAFLGGLGQRPAHVCTVVTMAKRVPVVRVVRPAHPFLLDALTDRIEELLAGGRMLPAGEACRPGPAAEIFSRSG